MLRTSLSPINGLMITKRLMEERELNLADKRLVKSLQKRVGAVLRNMRDRGLVKSGVSRKGGLLLWTINRPT